LSTQPAYSFGDSAIAAERLAIVAEVFAPTTRSLLEGLDTAPDRVLDLGCGPGHSTALLATLFPHAELVAIERSDAFAAQAAERVPTARVIVGDVTAPLPGEFGLVYSRFLLSHLPDIGAAVANWCRAVAPGGSLVLEEPERIIAADPLFARYEELVSAVVATSGADMYAGAALAGYAAPPDFARALDDAIDPHVTAGAAAAMFWRNAMAWGSSADAIIAPAARHELVAELQQRVDDSSLAAIEWRLQRLVLTRAPA
jgi:trans-aconitate 2-methyltransferase